MSTFRHLVPLRYCSILNPELDHLQHSSPVCPSNGPVEKDVTQTGDILKDRGDARWNDHLRDMIQILISWTGNHVRLVFSRTAGYPYSQLYDNAI